MNQEQCSLPTACSETYDGPPRYHDTFSGNAVHPNDGLKSADGDSECTLNQANPGCDSCQPHVISSIAAESSASEVLDLATAGGTDRDLPSGVVVLDLATAGRTDRDLPSGVVVLDLATAGRTDRDPPSGVLPSGFEPWQTAASNFWYKGRPYEGEQLVSMLLERDAEIAALRQEVDSLKRIRQVLSFAP
jgi:hypothetical protein